MGFYTQMNLQADLTLSRDLTDKIPLESAIISVWELQGDSTDDQLGFQHKDSLEIPNAKFTHPEQTDSERLTFPVLLAVDDSHSKKEVFLQIETESSGTKVCRVSVSNEGKLGTEDVEMTED